LRGKVNTTLPAELLRFDNRLSAIWAGLLDLDKLLPAFCAEVRASGDVVIWAAFHLEQCSFI
jgi:hypothetical protein